MNPKSFFSGLAAIALLQLVVNLLLLKWVKPLQDHTGFIFAAMGVMFLFCITLYGAARVIVRSTLTRLFIQLIMVAVFVKILLCLALIVIYKQVFLPADLTFVWSFLFIYITSTIYEVIFLEKVGRQKHNPAS
jgi:hypothetical protein